jgi:hypothetical protein
VLVCWNIKLLPAMTRRQPTGVLDHQAAASIDSTQDVYVHADSWSNVSQQCWHLYQQQNITWRQDIRAKPCSSSATFLHIQSCC